MEFGAKIYGILACLIIFIIFIYSFSLINESNEYKVQYSSCIDKHNLLVTEYNSILNTYNSSANEQINDYNLLVDKYNDLLNEYKILDENSLNPPYVHITNRTIKLNFYFKNETKLQVWSWPLESLENSFYKGQIMREKEISEMDKYLPELSKKFNNTKYLSINNQLAIDLRPYIEKEYFYTFGKHIYNKYLTDEERIEAVCYVKTILYKYTQEIEETPRLPLETLLGAGGDCEDTAVLTASILKAMNSDWKVYLVYVDLDNIEDPKEINHVLVYINTDTYSNYIETTGNIEINPYEKVVGYNFEIK